MDFNLNDINTKGCAFIPGGDAKTKINIDSLKKEDRIILRQMLADYFDIDSSAKLESEEQERLYYHTGNNITHGKLAILRSKLFIGAQEVENIVKKLGSENVAERRRAAALLTSEVFNAPKTAIPALLKTLNDTDAEVRRAAAMALANTGSHDPKVVRALNGALLNDANIEVRRNAARGIAHAGAAGIKLLFEALDKTDVNTRRVIATALSNLRPSKEEEEILLKAYVRALNDKDSTVRRYMTAGIFNLGPAAKPLLSALDKLMASKDAVTREYIVRGLSKIGRGNKEAIMILREAFHDKEAAVRFNAVVSLGAITDPKSKEAENVIIDLDRLARKDESASVKEVANRVVEMLRAERER